jgi:hypothetical protein
MRVKGACFVAKVFRQGELSFRYPDNWRLEKEPAESGWSITLYSPDTAFLSVTLDEEAPAMEHMAETALAVLREEYPDLDADETTATIAGQPAVGHDIAFFSLDLTNTCWTRSFHTSQGTVLLLFQLSDIDLERYEPLFRAVCASLTLDEDTD